MAYVEPSHFDGKDSVLIYVAGSTAEARRVEALLTEDHIDYTLGSEPFLHMGALAGISELPGVGFYVIAGQAQYCRNLLAENQLKVGLVS